MAVFVFIFYFCILISEFCIKKGQYRFLAEEYPPFYHLADLRYRIREDGSESEDDGLDGFERGVRVNVPYRESPVPLAP
ncbi:MAG: hypothetical protein FWG09_02320, partial [Synergistaceae bacterium]|nr:hypothetical protein [Synergistaceae bacterium]